MSFELFEDEFGDVRNARTLAVACDLAYNPEAEGAPLFKTHLNMDARLISVENTQAYVASNDDHILVAFRGSENPATVDGFKDWFLTNALNLLIVPEGPLAVDFLAAGVGAKFHQGFVSAIGTIWPTLFPVIQEQVKAKDRPLWITGHSLGGALAMLGSWLLKQKFINVHQVYTYGAPMVGNSATAAAFAREFPNKIFRYVNAPDPVPLLPMMSLAANDFSHTGKEVVLGSGAAADLIQYLQSIAGDTVAGLLAGDAQQKVWAGILQKVEAHFMNHYKEHLA